MFHRIHIYIYLLITEKDNDGNVGEETDNQIYIVIGTVGAILILLSLVVLVYFKKKGGKTDVGTSSHQPVSMNNLQANERDAGEVQSFSNDALVH